MKRVLYFIAFIALCVALKVEELARYDNIRTQHQEAEIEAQIERLQQAEKIGELEKELRIIKTDIDLMQNGSKK